MKRISLFIIFIALCSTLYADSYQENLSKYIQNQNKVKTFVGSGTIRVKLMKPDGSVIQEMESSIAVYMKHPDLFKLVITSPVSGYIVQKGNLLTQKVGNSSAVTNKVDESSDLFNKYFMLGLDSVKEASGYASVETVNIGNEVLTKYRFVSKDTSVAQIPGMKITHKDVYFSGNGMLRKIDLLSESATVIRSEMEYTLKDGVYVANMIKTTTSIQNMNMVNEIHYNAVSVNTEVLDKEFDIK